jgi:hypothetical protein
MLSGWREQKGSVMSVAKERIERLERDMRRLREGMLVLAIALIATFAWSVVQATPGELTLRRLAIVDDDGKERIVAATRPEGDADLSYYDTNGKLRISAGTHPEGDANVQHFDPDGRQRINLGTGPAGEAVLDDDDRDQKERIGALRFPDGYSGIALRSSNGESVWMKTSE